MKRAPRDDEAPKVYSDIIDFACGLDRTFFRDNPCSRSYVRRYVPGEFWPHDSHVDRALVEYVALVECAHPLVSVAAIGSARRARRPLFDLETLDALGANRHRLQ